MRTRLSLSLNYDALIGGIVVHGVDSSIKEASNKYFNILGSHSGHY
jgi:hypothetical protein